MKKKILLSLLMATCLTACGGKPESQENKIQHYAIYCDSHHYDNPGSEYSRCHCKSVELMKEELLGKNIISMQCENVTNNSNFHIHYVVVYTD